ncbi:MAG: NUDIX domain-containing protein [Elusimicrobia bacterium]|nr:NUDIX domain-containing protein [Elusimicrobiota bacterium]
MRTARETAAGGLVGRAGKILLVKVTNLQGEVRWTFPKGHLEKGETPLKAALREVEEETGWRCRSLGPLGVAGYRFRRNGRPVAKTVRWYRMEPVERTGRPDAVEIMTTRWVDFRATAGKLSYPSDLRLIQRYRAGLENPAPLRHKNTKK